ncbi:glycine betaine ABC transporter substrate-binding protein [Guptibacillus hwajinpoensis]|uniref:ABC transporter substrate-binding protein n=1 Tax=Guptibacillus hwajinpoensis TaxID=208199 RepID=UPI001CD4A5B5|nr:glycine betaine ABC transporter substrate-binding protein [Pseudalkalibacillus hwajinpoensis]MCA0989712.1 glycine/betaine ABC transporter substrate-binding protein [Pseudalkalibacillus hwajinpoensis]
MRKMVCFIGCLLLIVACQGEEKQTKEMASSEEGPTITLGSKAFTEQYLLMKMTALLLMEEGYEVEEVRFLDSPSIREAFLNNIVDLYWEYTNTAKIIYHKDGPGYDANEAYQFVKKVDEKKEIIWLDKSEFNSSWGLIMKKSFASEKGITSVSDLVSYMNKDDNPSLKMATNEEYLMREDGLDHLEDVYNFKVNQNQLLAVDSELLSLAVKEERVQVAVGMVTDSRIEDYDLVILQDNRMAFPPYDAAPVVQKTILEDDPGIREPLEALARTITNEEMVHLNYRVDVLHQDVGKVAKDFLQKSGLLPDE